MPGDSTVLLFSLLKERVIQERMEVKFTSGRI